MLCLSQANIQVPSFPSQLGCVGSEQGFTLLNHVGVVVTPAEWE